MKKSNKIGMMIVACGMLAATSCSDYSDYNTAPVDLNAMAGKTLWQNIQENENLTNFAKIIEKADFVTNLNNPRFYTVFAPLDGTYNADSVLALESDVILKEFVKQHVVEYNHPIISGLDETLLSVNGKSHPFTSTNYGEGMYASVDKVNLPASNGVMHLLSSQENFYCNIYENVNRTEGCDKFKEYIMQYDEKYIDESNSILGPINSAGEQTYEYIEYAHRNNVINDILHAKLENEDSTYTMLFPNDKAWDASYNRINSDYNYIAKVSYMDLSSITAETAGSSIAATVGKADITVASPEYLNDSITKGWILNNTTFSHTFDRNKKLMDENATVLDTLYSTSRRYLASARDVQDYTVSTSKMSNGYVRVVDSIPFKPWDTFEPVLRTRAAVRYLKSTVSTESAKKSYLLESRDTLFKYVPKFIKERIVGDYSDDETLFRCTSAIHAATSSQPEIDFALSDVLSTTYHIYVVTVPSQFVDTEESRTPEKPYYLSFYLNYTDADNKQQKVQLNLAEDADPAWGPVTEVISKKNHIVTKAGYVNVIDLGEFTFPICYSGTEAYPNLMMCHTQTFNTSSKRNKYEQDMRVAGVFLFPVEADTYFKNKE